VKHPFRYAVIPLTALLAALGVAVFGGSAATAKSSSSSTSTPVHGGTLVYGADREPTCLDPHNSGDMPQTYVARQYLDSLVSERPDGSVVPWLATSWTITNDGKTYTFQIKKGVKFTDGEPLNAQAVVDNFKQELDPATEDATDWGYLYPYYVSSKATGPYTVQLILKRPDSSLLDAFGQAFFGIEAPNAMARGLKVNCQSPVGTGPFIVKSWIHGQEINLVRNPNYNSAPANARHQGPAYLAGITWRFLEEPATRYAALQNGQANLIFSIPTEDQTAAEHDPNLSVQQFVHSGNGNNITINANQPPFNSLDVREAFVDAANVAQDVKSAYMGAYPVENTVLSTGTPFHDPDPSIGYTYSETKAKQLLTAAGYTKKNSQGYLTKNGQVLSGTFIYASDSGDTPPATLSLYQDIAAQEKAVGIDVVFKPLSYAQEQALYLKYNPHLYNLAAGYWNSPTPEVLYIIDSPTTPKVPNFNNGQYASNTQLDNILLEANATTNRTQEQQLYYQAQVLAQKQYWELPLYPVTTDLGINKNTHNVWIEPSEGEPVLSDAWISK
jgi:peptide/nickel transport system substrate-binding protein